MHVLPRVRLELARRPWLYWAVVGVCALIVWSGIAGAAAAARQERARWGDTRTVMVATRSAAAGQPLVAVARQYPVAMVPTAALGALPAHAVAAHAVGAGEIITDPDVAGGHDPPASWLVFAVVGTHHPALVVGDAVTIFGDGERWCAGLAVAATTDRVDVAVPPSCAAAVSLQVSSGSTVIARSALS